MYIQRIFARNFRAFGDGKTVPALDWELNQGMNILIGENDAGKTAIVDAIRQILGTTSFESTRIFEHDFYVEGANRADILVIEATLRDLSAEQEAAILEWLTYETVPIPPKLDRHSSANWTPDPPQTGHLFQVKLDTRSEATRGDDVVLRCSEFLRQWGVGITVLPRLVAL